MSDWDYLGKKLPIILKEVSISRNSLWDQYKTIRITVIRKVLEDFWGVVFSSYYSSNCAGEGCESDAKHAEAVLEIRLFWLGCNFPLSELITPSQKQRAQYNRLVGGKKKVDSIKSCLLSCAQLCRKST